MKSLLVDVLRQAKSGNPDQTLSDSGSFDTTQSEIPETANDSVIEEGVDAADALKLFETSASLDATFAKPDDDAEFRETTALTLDDASGDTASEPLKPAPSAPLPSVHNKGPRIAQFAPLACVVLAATAAASWVGYQHLKTKYAESEFATTQMGSASMHSAELDSTGKPLTVERFPFIGTDRPASDVESTK